MLRALFTFMHARLPYAYFPHVDGGSHRVTALASRSHAAQPLQIHTMPTCSPRKACTLLLICNMFCTMNIMDPCEFIGGEVRPTL